MNGVPSEAKAFLPWSSVSVTCGLMDSSFMDNGNLLMTMIKTFPPRSLSFGWCLVGVPSEARRRNILFRRLLFPCTLA